MKRAILTEMFFDRPALAVAPDLLGKFLVRKQGKKEIALMINEVEAYTGPEDKACHAYKGRTKRTEVMFGPPGHWYVYLVYGMYHMLNIVVDKVEHPAAVLIRSGMIVNVVNNVTGSKEVYSIVRANNRTDGPGKLTRELKIDKRLNGKLATKQTGLWIEDRGVQIAKKDIQTTPRIGIDYAGEWAKKPYRFVLE